MSNMPENQFNPEGHVLSTPVIVGGRTDSGAVYTTAGAPGLPQIVFPPDTRTEVDDTRAYPWNTIGQLVMSFPNGKTYTGTGTLVDRQHVLTAAHNVFGNDIGGFVETVYFIPARNGDEMPYGVYGASRVFITEEYYTLSPADPNATPAGDVEDYTQYSQDYAIERQPARRCERAHYGLSRRQACGHDVDRPVRAREARCAVPLLPDRHL